LKQHVTREHSQIIEQAQQEYHPQKVVIASSLTQGQQHRCRSEQSNEQCWLPPQPLSYAAHDETTQEQTDRLGESHHRQAVAEVGVTGQIEFGNDVRN